MTSQARGPESLEFPVWYAPLREPSWLVPRVRDDAPTVVFGAEPWDGSAVDAAGRDLRLGLPMYLAESIRFGTNARPIAMYAPVGETDPPPDAAVVVRSAVAPGGEASVRLRIFDPARAEVTEIIREANDAPTLGAALEGLPRACVDAVADHGVRPIWNSLYALPSGAARASYVRGLRACRRMSEEALPPSADRESLADRRNDVRATLGGLGALATSTTEPFPALLFFGAVLAAHDAGSSVVGEFRLQVNARCTIATDPLDPVYAMTALVLRIFGDLDTSERRIRKLRSADDEAVRLWAERVSELM